MSSMITDTSAGPPSSFVPTPSIQQSTLPGPVFFAPSSVPTEFSPFGTVYERGEITMQIDEPSPVKRSQAPPGIDIRSISTHAQAEALVARAQRRVLDQSDDLDEQEIKTLGLNVGDGHTPLSARLAAYGESLVIEKKFKEEEEKKRRSLLVNSVSASTLAADRVSEPSDGDTARPSRLELQMSLQERRRRSPSSREYMVFYVKFNHCSDMLCDQLSWQNLTRVYFHLRQLGMMPCLYLTLRIKAAFIICLALVASATLL